MKNIIYKWYVKHCLLLLFVAFAVTSCDQYLDVDTDTDSPTVAPLNQLLPQVQLTIGQMGDFNNLSGEIIQVYTHQLTAREEQDQYGSKAGNILMNNDWNNVYLGLTDIETLILQGTESGDKIYVGIAQVLKAYTMSIAVDLWGDVPFSEAILLEEGIVGPVFDNQETIYQAVLDLIDAGKVNIKTGEGLLTPGGDDLFYSGSTSKWIKFANTLKLKLYTQIRLSSLFNQADFDALVTEDDFFTSSSDDFQFAHTANISPTDERCRLFVDAYGGAQVTKYASPWFYEILMGMNPNIHTGNKDPRIPYYWANQLVAGQFPRDQGDVDSGDPHADYWDASTGFHTIRFASIGPDRDHAVQNDATFPGIFPAGGRYDDGQGFARTIASGTGVAPKRILTFDEFLYIQAELMEVGLMAGDAGAKLTEAMTASFEKVDEVVAGTGTSQTVPVLAGSTEVSDFMDNIDAEFAAASDEKKLEIIMTQKWVATFGDPLDQHNDYRRTGYPVYPDPNGPSPEYQLDNADGWPLQDNLTSLTSDYQHSMFWPQREINLNQNAPTQKNPTTYKVFWAK